MARSPSRRPIGRTLLGLLLACVAGAATAFETMHRVRAEGVLRVGVLTEEVDAVTSARIARLGQMLGVRAILVPQQRTDHALEALAAGAFDLLAAPVDRRRPLPGSLALSWTVDHARLALAGARGPIGVRFGSDAWYRVRALRQAGNRWPLEVLPATLGEEDLARRMLSGRILHLDVAFPPSPRLQIVDADQPRAWVLRRADRVLQFRVNSFIQAEALRADAARHRPAPSPSLLRARLRDGAITPWDALAREYGRYYGFDWRLLLAIMHRESRFDPQAVSVSGARGLMQLKPEAAIDAGVPSIEHPEDNVLAGVRYLHWTLAHFPEDLDPAERLWLALAAYNAGVRHVLDARKRAARTGRDPRRWSGQVEQALLELGEERDDLRADVVVRYVRDIRATMALYFRVTEGPPLPSAAPTLAGGLLSP